jgi:trehalose 6-phosphate phosphatase
MHVAMPYQPAENFSAKSHSRGESMNAVAQPNAESPPRKTAPLPRPGERWALFLDVDGCLVEFQPVPELVKIPESVCDGLAEMQHFLGGAVALVSGRTLEDLDQLFAPLRLPSAGQYGLKRRSADGEVHDVLLPDAATVEFVRAQTLALAMRLPALHVEDKGHSIALHYRNAPFLARDVAMAAASIVAPLDGAYEVQPGALVQEIKPATCSKGTAVRAFLSEAPFQSRVPVFVGDDFADESAFAAVNTLGGISIAVGVDRHTQADYALSSPAEVRRWLTAVMEALSADA